MMKAILVGDNGKLLWQEVSRPVVGECEVLVRVAATAVNRADLLQVKGLYPPPPGASDILGLEASGEIVEVGTGVTRHKVGDRICCLLAGGGYAEFVAVDQDSVLPLPSGLSLVEAAALPEALYTAYLNIFMEGALTAGESVLVHAGASGVGSAAIQIGVALGHRVFATASTSKLGELRKWGAIAIDREKDDFVARIKEETNGRGVDVIFDPVGASYLGGNVKSLAKKGRLVIIGMLGGVKAELFLPTLMMKRLRIIGSVLRSRSVAEKKQITTALEQRVWPLVESGEIRPIIHTTLSIQEADKAHDMLRTNSTTGKVVLTIGQ
jgi:putative PIG3 family NAD(P)H quinone oxidoreductase